jgi:hypothetical protein
MSASLSRCNRAWLTPSHRVASNREAHTKCPPPTDRDPPGSVGPITADEARLNLGTELFIAAAARPLQQSIEPTPRDTERPAHPIHGPDPPVLRNEAERHVDSLAK